MIEQGTLLFADAPPATTRHFHLPDANVTLTDGFYTESESRALFARLHAETQWRQDYIQINGKPVPLPRLQAWYGDPCRSYTYSGIKLDPLPWTPTLRQMRAKVETETGAMFNSVLLNLYRDGKDSVSYHADDEPNLGECPTIASVSFGAMRIFQMRRHLAKRWLPRVDISLFDGSLLVMRGETQKHWQHRIPKTMKPVGERINLTFRFMEGE